MQSILINILFGALILLVLVLIVFIFILIRTMDYLNKTVKTVSSDVDVLMHQANSLMAKVNILLEDVNGKVATIDPLFTAVADLSKSVSAVNDSGRNFVSKFTKKTVRHVKRSGIIKIGRLTSQALNRKKR